MKHQRPSLPLHDLTNNPAQQGGGVLLIVLLLLSLGGLNWLLQRPATQALAQARERHTDLALAAAKEALLGYAAAYPEQHRKGAGTGRAAYVPGHLPCPDTGSPLNEAASHEGTEAGSCGSKGVSVIGHFPWRSLGIPPPRDGSGECLWYAVSGNYKANPKADLLNPDTPGQFQILGADGLILAGATAEEQPVAVLIAPGPPLAGQQRQHKDNEHSECRLDYDASQFLEAVLGSNKQLPDPNADATSKFVMLPASASFNDRLLWINRQELYPQRIARRPDFARAAFDPDFTLPPAAASETAANAPPALTQRVAYCLAHFANHPDAGRLPWAAPLALSGTAALAFMNEKFADEAHRLAGRPPFSIGHTQLKLQTRFGTLASCPAQDRHHSACRLLRSDNCAAFLPVAGFPTPADGASHVNSPHGWWDKWKERLFYVVAPGFAPGAPDWSGDCALQPEQCLHVLGQPYAAVLIHAGAALPGQVRTQLGDRLDLANYLEGSTAALLQTGGTQVKPAGNDQFACIQAPSPDDTRFRVIPNCGRQDCQQAAQTFITQLHATWPPADPGAALATLQACPCLGAAQILLSQACTPTNQQASCRYAREELQRCA